MLWRYGLIICSETTISWVVRSNTWTSTEKRRESVSKRCVEPLMAAVQREQIHSCSHWLERRGVICSNQPGCCYKSPPGSAVSFTTLYFLSSRLSVFISAFLVSDEQKNLSWFKATWASLARPLPVVITLFFRLWASFLRPPFAWQLLENQPLFKQRRRLAVWWCYTARGYEWNRWPHHDTEERRR